ncbi:helix-turn-helix domain-containing protein [Dysgonomonas sp. GY75]|uniref:helix-turn-helix domain-containing protein n=1 Tax=Dysgonomonas sp. GY75 TaxID=2780419 RepID=UPI00188351C2|nr:helix-turn-helix domain-containing protein [Dysgonomonas sp. GY75]MBF0650812.1 helix-turn-helix domain-containing protein [Dysgonomonas sp. GY75]
MEHFKEYLEKIINLLTARFDAIEKKIDRLSRVKDVTEGDLLLDNQDVCQLLNITFRTLQRYKQHKILPYCKVRGKSYYRKSDVLAMLNKKE